MTIIVVEQSLNVATAIAERAVFLEKGQVRFEGATAELMERDDLARAVFLGGEVTDMDLPRVHPARETHVMLAVSILNSQVVYDGFVQGLAIALVVSHRARLPGYQGHQLRCRQHGPGRRRPARHPRPPVPRPVLVALLLALLVGHAFRRCHRDGA